MSFSLNNIKTMEKSRIALTRKAFIGLLLGVSISLVGCEEKENTDNSDSVAVEESKQEEFAEAKVISDTNLESSIKNYLQKRSELEGEAIQSLITEDFDSVNGVFAYPVKVLSVGDRVELDLGLSKIEVPKNNILTYQGFMDKVSELSKNNVGLALVKYDNNKITGVEIFKLDGDFGDIQKSIQTFSLKEEVMGNEKVEKAEKNYKELTSEDWQGMALLTAREAVLKDLAPVFIVPHTSLNSKKDLADTYYYIVVGTLKEIKEDSTVLTSYDGKTINLDFPIDVENKGKVGSPIWMHVLTQNSIIKNIELQDFPEADVSSMAQGITTYINVLSAEADTN